MKQQRPDWFLIANATRARLLRSLPGEPLELVRVFEHPAGRRKTAELGDDKAGYAPSGHGFGGAAYEPHPDAHRKEHRRFAHEVAQFIEHEARGNAFASIRLFASSPFLGELKEALGGVSAHLLGGAHDIDLTSVGMAELPRRMQLALAH